MCKVETLHLGRNEKKGLTSPRPSSAERRSVEVTEASFLDFDPDDADSVSAFRFRSSISSCNDAKWLNRGRKSTPISRAHEHQTAHLEAETDQAYVPAAIPLV